MQKKFFHVFNFKVDKELITQQRIWLTEMNGEK